jgi:hypothetical protein
MVFEGSSVTKDVRLSLLALSRKQPDLYHFELSNFALACSLPAARRFLEPLARVTPAFWNAVPSFVKEREIEHGVAARGGCPLLIKAARLAQVQWNTSAVLIEKAEVIHGAGFPAVAAFSYQRRASA